MTQEVKSTESEKLKTYQVYLQRAVTVELAAVQVEAPDQATAESLAFERANDDSVVWSLDLPYRPSGTEIEVVEVEEVKDEEVKDEEVETTD